MTSRSRPSSPRFHTIKAVFEGPDVTHSRPSYRITRTSSPGPVTNKDSHNPALNLISRETSENEPNTIDTIFGLPTIPTTAPSRFHTRTLVYLKPAWIGPLPALRSATPGIMARKVTITYNSPGLQPPVYVISSLSEPEWETLEMDVSQLPDGEFEFAKTFHAQEGEYQYKFRLGPGDWWACDEGRPVVDDGFGNRNNLLVVKDESPVNDPRSSSESAIPALHVPSSQIEQAEPIHNTSERSELPAHESRKMDERGEDAAPLFAHESDNHNHLEPPPEDVPVNFSRMDTQPIQDNDDEGDVEPSHHPGSPLFRHETLAPPSIAQIPSPDRTPGVDEDEDDPFEHPPLMKHEPAGPDAVEAEHAPLFGHESAGMSSPHRVDHTRSSGPPPAPHEPKHQYPENAIPKEADPDDPGLEPFPTHHEGIMSSLRRASLRNPDDEAASISPVPRAHSVSLSSHRSSLPSVLEDEEEEVIAHNPTDNIASLDTKVEDFAAEVQKHRNPTERPAALMTPPRTPDAPARPEMQAPHASDHHHRSLAEADMVEESKHDFKHHANQNEPQSLGMPLEPTANMDGEAKSKIETEDAHKGEDNKPEQQDDTEGSIVSPASEPVHDSGMSLDAALGLGLMVVVGAAAAWLAFKMQGANKDGAAVLASA